MEKIIGLYSLGLGIVTYLFLNGRFSVLLVWPYIIYGFGLVFAMFALETGTLHFSNMLDEYSILLSMFVMISFLVIITLIDIKLLPHRMIIKTMEFNKLGMLKRIVDSPVFLIYLLVHLIVFFILYYLSFQSGELNIGDYNYSELDMLKYWGPIAYLSENIATLMLLFISRIMIYKKWTKSNIIASGLFFLFIILRLFMGTRMFIMKIIGVTLIIYLLRYKRYLKVTILTLITLIMGTLLGFMRSGIAIEDFDFSQIFYSFNLEAYFNDLTLIVAANSLGQDNFIYQPGILLAIPLNSLPRFLADRAEFINLFYDRSLMLPFLSSSIESVSPVGAMSFLADSIYSFGGFYWLFLAVIFVVTLAGIAKLKGSSRYFMCYFLGAVSLNLWRDSFFITFKVVFIHGLLNLLFLLSIMKIFSKPLQKRDN